MAAWAILDKKGETIVYISAVRGGFERLNIEISNMLNFQHFWNIQVILTYHGVLENEKLKKLNVLKMKARFARIFVPNNKAILIFTGGGSITYRL